MEAAYPCIPKWWQWTAQQLQTQHCLITPFGRRRWFFGRAQSDTTLREAVAFVPQSTTADRMNLGLWRTWKHEKRVELLAQTHDSITFQFRESENENAVIKSVLELLAIELRANNGRRYVVPGEAKVGWNWGASVSTEDRDKAQQKGLKVPRLNLDGLVKWSPDRPDVRTRHVGLKRIMS